MATNQNLPFSETEVDDALGYMIDGVSLPPSLPPSQTRFVESGAIFTYLDSPISVSQFTDESVITSTDGLTQQSSNASSFATTQAISESTPNYFTTLVTGYWLDLDFNSTTIWHKGITIPHGLGAVPKEFWIHFECYNTTAGVDGLSSQIAQELSIRGITVGQLNDWSLDALYGSSIWADDTNIYWKFDNSLSSYPSGNTNYALPSSIYINHNYYFGYDHPIVPNSHRLRATAIL